MHYRMKIPPPTHCSPPDDSVGLLGPQLAPPPCSPRELFFPRKALRRLPPIVCSSSSALPERRCRRALLTGSLPVGTIRLSRRALACSLMMGALSLPTLPQSPVRCPLCSTSRVARLLAHAP